ncbi:alpha/beta fold hydrolase [Kitasatospora sp. NPDC059599]|uniref:alpha/beta fold hydrolase n=1 Tax=Kitasatospora sp. NPDC059599 TaxID=3346880 RepID=UPI0036911F0D
MAGTDQVKPRLVFVHGIGGLRDPQQELAEWKRELAEGARKAGYASEISALTMDWSADSAFAYYGDLFDTGEAQGVGSTDEFDEEQAELMLDLLGDLLDDLAGLSEQRGNQRLARVRAQVRADGQGQGVGAAGRHLSGVIAAVAAVPGLSWGAQRLSAGRLLRVLTQPGRYLRRAEPDATGRTLDRRVRERVLQHLDPTRPAIVVAHSLGTVVALEALAEYNGPVRLLVTIGSPIATRGVVWPRLVPQPPATPESVSAWTDFWDSDDIVVPRRTLANLVKPNTAGVLPVPHPLESATLWSHSASTYLRREEVARPVMKALAVPGRP